MKKIGLLFSGSGSNDGSEIQEAVLTMLELDKRECEVVAMAPNIDQMHVVNHYTSVVIYYMHLINICLLYTSPSPRDRQKSRMPSSA